MYQGSIVALITPMQINGEVDLGALTALIDRQIAAGTQAILILGTTGESPTLSTDEKTRIIKTTVNHVSHRVPVMVGTGSNCTASTITATKTAKELGADAALLVNPYYNKPTQEGLYQHYIAVADKVDLPQLIYNIPGRTGGDMLPDTVIRLSQHPHIIGIKECSGELDRIDALRQHCPNDFALLSGDDDNINDFLPRGGHGVISVVANIVPAQVQARCHALLSGDQPTANHLANELQPLCDALFIEPNPIPCKWALAQMGLISPGIRLPLTPLTPAAQQKVAGALRTLDLITDNPA